MEHTTMSVLTFQQKFAIRDLIVLLRAMPEDDFTKVCYAKYRLSSTKEEVKHGISKELEQVFMDCEDELDRLINILLLENKK